MAGLGMFPVAHWGTEVGVDFGNLEIDDSDQNRLEYLPIFQMSESKLGTIAFRFKLKADLTGVNIQGIYTGREVDSDDVNHFGNGVNIGASGGVDGRLQVVFDSDFVADPPFGDEAALYMRSTTGYTSINIWHSVLMSWDLGNGILRLYVDDADDLDVGSSIALDQPVLHRAKGSALAAFSNTAGTGYVGPSHFQGCFQFFYFHADAFLDFSIESKRRKFFNTTGQPVNLGTNGQDPTGSQPHILFRGNPSGFPTNEGSGPSFTLAGDEAKLSLCG